MSSISISSDNKVNQVRDNTEIRKWSTLYHNGVCFPPEYEFKGLEFKIKGEKFLLNREQEELIYAWAKKKIHTILMTQYFR